jgi:hypothetical protein
MADHLRKYESLSVQSDNALCWNFLNDVRSFTLTPQRMRMIVEAFKETLELGLQKPNQVVVRMMLTHRPRGRSALPYTFPWAWIMT